MSRFNKHVIVVGSARSGTSWLSETLAQPYRYRMLFEPEHETRTPKGHLICDIWLTDAAATPEAYRYLKRVFQNRVDCDWIAQNSNRKFKRHLWPFIPKKYIIKFVRANLAAQFMYDTFKIPVIHIIRNPYDVIRSQQQVKFPWLYDLLCFVSQDRLVKLIQDVFDYDITQYESLSDVEILTLRWCVENVVPLEVFPEYRSNITLVRYEDLISDIDLFFKLCDDFDLEAVPNLKTFYKRPSSKTHPDSALVSQKNVSSAFTQDEMLMINTILDIFKVTLYSRKK